MYAYAVSWNWSDRRFRSLHRRVAFPSRCYSALQTSSLRTKRTRWKRNHLTSSGVRSRRTTRGHGKQDPFPPIPGKKKEDRRVGVEIPCKKTHVHFFDPMGGARRVPPRKKSASDGLACSKSPSIRGRGPIERPRSPDMHPAGSPQTKEGRFLCGFREIPWVFTRIASEFERVFDACIAEEFAGGQPPGRSNGSAEDSVYNLDDSSAPIVSFSVHVGFPFRFVFSAPSFDPPLPQISSSSASHAPISTLSLLLDSLKSPPMQSLLSVLRL